MSEDTKTGAAPNPDRGEVEIRLKTPPHGQEQPYVMRATWQALAEIETTTGKGAVRLARDFESHDYRTTDVVAVIAAGLRASGAPADLAKVSEMVFMTGVLVCYPFAYRLLVVGLIPDKEEDPAEGEAKAANGK